MKNFKSINLYDDKGIGKSGQPIHKMRLLTVDCDDEPCLCDMCDEIKPCAHIDDVMHQNVSVICKDCLQLILNQFNEG